MYNAWYFHSKYSWTDNTIDINIDCLSVVQLLCLFDKSNILHLCTPEVFGGSVLLMFFVILCYVFVLFVLVMCSVYPMLPVSLYFQFLVTPSVFAKSKFLSDGNLFVLFQAYTWNHNSFVCQSKNSYICSHVWPILKDSCKITYYFIH